MNAHRHTHPPLVWFYLLYQLMPSDVMIASTYKNRAPAAMWYPLDEGRWCRSPRSDLYRCRISTWFPNQRFQGHHEEMGWNKGQGYRRLNNMQSTSTFILYIIYHIYIYLYINNYIVTSTYIHHVHYCMVRKSTHLLQSVPAVALDNHFQLLQSFWGQLLVIVSIILFKIKALPNKFK